MNEIVEKYLKELLYDYDCVIIPNFGGFISTYMSSEISIAKNKISPPRKQIKFNDKLTSNDSLLIDFIADNENISILDAYNYVEAYIKYIKLQIVENSQYTIESLGRLYLNEEKNFSFEQYLRFNYLKESFGLSELYFKPIDRSQESKSLFKQKKPKFMASTINNELEDDDEPVNHYKESADEEEEEDDELMEELERQRKLKKSENLAVYYIMAILALVLTAGTAYYLNMDKTTYAIGSFSPLSLFGQSDTSNSENIDNKLLPEESEDEVTTDESTSSQNDDSNTETTQQNYNKEQNSNTVASAAKVVAEVEIDPSNLVNEKTGRFYIIVGGFKSKRKAAKFLEEMVAAGNPAKILDSYDESGVYRVSVADFSAYDEAQTQRKAYANAYGEELWVLNY